MSPKFDLVLIINHLTNTVNISPPMHPLIYMCKHTKNSHFCQKTTPFPAPTCKKLHD